MKREILLEDLLERGSQRRRRCGRCSRFRAGYFERRRPQSAWHDGEKSAGRGA